MTEETKEMFEFTDEQKERLTQEIKSWKDFI